jgi:hypothetical protein
MRLALICILFGLVLGEADAQDRSASAPQKHGDYITWTKQYRRRPKPLLSGFLDAKIWFTVSSVECESNTPVSSSQTSCRSPMNTCQVSSTELVACQHATCCPGFSGAYRQLKPEDFEQLKMLISRLPDDFEHLPPLGQRLVIQLVHKGNIDIRVYDEQRLPESVRNVVAIVGLGLSVLPQQSPALQ